MAFDNHTNFAVSTVAVIPSPAASGTSLTVAAGEGARFPAAPFNCTIAPIAAQPTPANAEIVRVTARTGDVFTIARAQEGTSARTIGVGDLIAATITAKSLTDLETRALTPDVNTTWTPVSTPPLTSIGPNNRSIRYGTLAFISFDVVWANTPADANPAVLTGVPIASSSQVGLTLSYTNYGSILQILLSSAAIYFYGMNGSGLTNGQMANKNFVAGGWYATA